MLRSSCGLRQCAADLSIVKEEKTRTRKRIQEKRWVENKIIHIAYSVGAAFCVFSPSSFTEHVKEQGRLADERGRLGGDAVGGASRQRANRAGTMTITTAITTTKTTRGPLRERGIWGIIIRDTHDIRLEKHADLR